MKQKQSWSAPLEVVCDSGLSWEPSTTCVMDSVRCEPFTMCFKGLDRMRIVYLSCYLGSRTLIVDYHVFYALLKCESYRWGIESQLEEVTTAIPRGGYACKEIPVEIHVEDPYQDRRLRSMSNDSNYISKAMLMSLSHQLRRSSLAPMMRLPMVMSAMKQW